MTDRRRLGSAMGMPADRWADLLVEQIHAAVVGGIDLVQLREPDLEAADLLALALRILREVVGARSCLTINERLDVALAAGASGVHLRERSFSASDASRLAPPGFRIGRSVHGVDGARAARGCQYLIAGTVLSTPSKAVTPLLGWEGLTQVVQAAGGVPVLGIGGLGKEVVPSLVASGAQGLAAIGAFIPDRSSDLSRFVQDTVRDLRFAFDSTQRLT